MTISLQAATREDAREVAVLHNRWVRNDCKDHIPDRYIDSAVSDVRVSAWEGWLKRRHVSTILARDNEKLVGFSTLHPEPGTGPDSRVAELIGIFALPSHRDSGVETALFERILAEARDRRFQRMVYWDLESKLQSRELFRALGFVDDSSRRVFLELPGSTLYESVLAIDLH